MWPWGYIYSDEDALVFDVDVGDGELVGQRHGCRNVYTVSGKQLEDVCEGDSDLVSSYGKDWDLHENAEVGWWGSCY
jgi:hypothetical protein